MQLGYTAGSRSRPRIGWARNIRRKQPKGALQDLTYRSSSAFAFAWNLFRMQLPSEVIGNFNEYLAKSQIMRMDPLGNRQKIVGTYTICDGDIPVEFHDAELAPPAGVFGANYTRYANPHSIMFSLSSRPLSDTSTTSRAPTGMRCHGLQYASPNTQATQAETSSYPTME